VQQELHRQKDLSQPEVAHSQKEISHLQDHNQQVLSQLQEVTQMLWLCCLIHKRAAQAVQKGSPHLMYLVHRLRKRYVYLHLKIVTYVACI
jgi:hypothetical protein